MLKKASANALIKSEIIEQYDFIFSITENDQVIKRFLCNCLDSQITELNLQSTVMIVIVISLIMSILFFKIFDFVVKYFTIDGIMCSYGN